MTIAKMATSDDTLENLLSKDLLHLDLDLYQLIYIAPFSHYGFTISFYFKRFTLQNTPRSRI